MARTYADLIKIVQDIVAESVKLKDEMTDQHDVPIGYVAVFCQDDTEYEEFKRLAYENGHLAEETYSGPVFVVPTIETASGALNVVKIRNPNPETPERGDSDFDARDYMKFKEKYLGQPGFSLIQREEFEMIEVLSPKYNVRIYFSDPPVKTHSTIPDALAKHAKELEAKK
jgi:hypothetical protein